VNVVSAADDKINAGLLSDIWFSKLEIKDKTLSEEYIEIIKDEVNVKEVLSNESMNDEVFLHVKITSELKEEGDAREIIRSIQDQRKNKGLSPDDVIVINVTYPNELNKTFEKYSQLIKDTTRAKEIVRKELNGVEETKINEFTIKLEVYN
jgi:isoleucyl-tRNA synthetase